MRPRRRRSRRPGSKPGSAARPSLDLGRVADRDVERPDRDRHRAPRPRGRPTRSSAAVRRPSASTSPIADRRWHVSRPESRSRPARRPRLCVRASAASRLHSRRALDRKPRRLFQRSAVIGSTYAPRRRTSKWTCGPEALPVAPASPSCCAGAHAVADVDVDAREMRDERAHAAAVGDHDRVAPAAVAPAGVDDLSAPGRADRRPQPGNDVDAAVEPGPAQAVAARDRGGDRPREPLRRDGHRACGAPSR